MTQIALVHGAGLGAWCWERLIPELEARGYQARAVDLPLNDPSADASRLAAMVVAAFAPFDDLVLVGHSISGLIIPVVAARRPVRRLVFLHAALPQSGSSLADQVAAEPGMFSAEMLKVPPLSWSDEAIVTHFLLHDCTPEVAHDACTRLRPSRLDGGLLVTQVTPLESWPDVPSSYIVCRDDRTITPAWARRAASERLGVEPIEIPGGHCPMFSRPAELAEALGRCLDIDGHDVPGQAGEAGPP
jgi:pimeloyl-ACP methyl ester carboxylesterase